MVRLIRPSALLWGLFLVLGGLALGLHLRAPGHPTLPWLTASLLALLGLRVMGLILEWRRQRVPGTRILLPAVLFLEGSGLVLAGSSHHTLQLRLGAALVLEVLLLILAVRAWRLAQSLPGAWPEARIAAAFEAFVPPRAAHLMALELVMLGSALRFLFGGFRTPAPASFSHHRETALRSILPILPLLIPGDFLLLKLVAKGNAVLELNLSEPVRVSGLLGLGRPTQRLAVSMDDPSAFIAALGRPCA